MHKEMEGMTNEQMFTAIIRRMDSMESNLNSRLDNMDGRLDSIDGRQDSMDSRLDNLESRFDKMESDMHMEFKAVRTEMDVAYKMLKQDIFVLNDKMDRIIYTKDIAGSEKMKIQVELLTKGYQELKEKIG